ncbi:MAG: ferrous iron transport protein B [Deltaproteobacteria bacterium]|jgi:ferrous iron transport protein B|nr:ferrous iron transport protein B [Deltaproteobacteria bacterium]
MRPVTIALAGNPNAGKTTIFNAITGARQHVGNYPGITVEKKTGLACLEGETIALVDLPGIYSLTAYSQEEVVARRMLTEERPDAALHIVDAGALERNLYLTVQLLELGIPTVVALNMMDEVRRRGDSIDTKRLSRLLGVPVVETVGRTGVGVTEALRTVLAVGREARGAGKRGNPWQSRIISYGTDIDPVLIEMTGEIDRCLADSGKNADMVYPSRWLALKYLENDPDIHDARFFSEECRTHFETQYDQLAKHLEKTLQTYPEAIIADFRYGYISGILRQDVVTRQADIAARRNFSDQIDRFLTHSWLGIFAMAAVFYCVYQIAFSLGGIPMDMVGALFDWAAEAAGKIIPDGLARSLIVSGIIKGAGGVMAFVPLIVIMFMLVAFLEDSGYMARIAYMLDRVFRLFGLHGASIMPYMISGGIAGGCAVPGVMGTRTLRGPKEKLATMLTLPFMACGAKIPVFLLIVGAFFAENNQAAIMLGITLSGWAIALLSAKILRSTVMRGEPTPFVMELPPYRIPTMRGLLLHTWERAWQYLKRAGTIILSISIVIWALLTFPALPEDMAQAYDEKIASAGERIENISSVYAASGLETDKVALDEAREALDALLNQKSGAALTHSFAGRIGLFFEPVSVFAGFDWRTNVALLGGVAAKEVLVSTLGTAYSLGDVDPEDAKPLRETIKADPGWNRANAASLMIFVLIYSPCVVTLATMRTETASWRWPLFSLVSSTGMAYALAVAVYQAGRIFLR